MDQQPKAGKTYTLRIGIRMKKMKCMLSCPNNSMFQSGNDILSIDRKGTVLTSNFVKVGSSCSLMI